MGKNSTMWLSSSDGPHDGIHQKMQFAISTEMDDHVPVQFPAPDTYFGTQPTSVHSVSICMRDVQVKLWNLLRTRTIPEHLRGVITTRCYINPHLPLPSADYPQTDPLPSKIGSIRTTGIGGQSQWSGKWVLPPVTSPFNHHIDRCHIKP